MTEPQIVELARKAKGGDGEAFEELCRQKTRSVIFNALGYVKNLADAEDIAQEVFVLMFRNIHKLKEPETINLWMLRIVQNRCKRFLVQNNKYAANLDIDDEKVVVEEDKTEFLPEAYAQDKDLRRRLYEIVMSLPAKRRESVIMYYYDDLSMKEIAETTGTTVQNVTSSIARARKMIKDEIEKMNVGDMKTLAAVAPVSVLGRALKEEAFFSVPDNSVATVQTKVFAAIKAMSAGGGSGALASAAGKALGITAGKGVAIIASAVIVVCAAVAAGAIPFPSPDAATEINAAGEVAFWGGSGTDGHVNPAGAEITSHNINIAETTWSIADGSGVVLYSGQGTDPSAALSAMKAGAQGGEYLLKYHLTDKEGNVIIKQRIFEIAAE